MTRFFYDTEFLDDGKTIELISIGIVCEDDGREYYAVNRDAPWKRIKKNDWLMANVVPTLPQPSGDWNNHMPKSWPIDFHSPLVKETARIATEVRDFIAPQRGANIELWADYCAYDHVALCQLFGTMMDLPDGMPMWTHDLEQLWETAGRPERPTQGDEAHNALADARWNQELFNACQVAQR
jgi:hypothetical protein